MTVKELKNILDKFDDDTIVVVRGYEEGVDEIRDIHEGFCLRENHSVPDWEGTRAFNKQKDKTFFVEKAIWLTK